MDLTQLANLGEFIGGIAVLVTLIYLAQQVRQNTRAVRRASARQTSEMNAEVLRAFADHAEVMTPWGFSNVGELTPAQATQHTAIWAMWFQGMEQTLADVREGTQAPEYALPYRDSLRTLLAEADARDWWERYRAWYSRSFQQEVDRLLPAPRREETTS